MPKNLNLKIFLVAIITITSSAKAEDPEMVRLGQASGGYIGGGFETLPISAYSPHDNRTFFILTTDPTIKKNGNSELINFYQREDYPHRFYTSSSV
jgi:hypothetical protein